MVESDYLVAESVRAKSIARSGAVQLHAHFYFLTRFFHLDVFRFCAVASIYAQRY